HHARCRSDVRSAETDRRRNGFVAGRHRHRVVHRADGAKCWCLRIPASFCGIYGMKPTYGLVPYTGIMPIEITLDHTGPMTANVRDNALLLEVLAGADGLDPRQYAPKVANYTEALEGGVKGLRIGIVREGFGHANSEENVDAK